VDYPHIGRSISLALQPLDRMVGVGGNSWSNRVAASGCPPLAGPWTGAEKVVTYTPLAPGADVRSGTYPGAGLVPNLGRAAFSPCLAAK